MSSIDVARAHEIMARFRPILPRPPLPAANADKPAAAALHLRAQPYRFRRRSLRPPRRQQGFFPVLPRPPSLLAFRRVLHVPFPSMQEQHLIPLLLQSSREAAVPTVPAGKELLPKLQESKVIAPQPMRPIGSSISVGTIEATLGTIMHPVNKKPEEVEEEMESEGLPAIISDSKNRVRLANAAYKEMVGQPELPWLESIVSPSFKRISGEVKLDLSAATTPALIASSNGFSCKVKIEWANNGAKNVISTSCDVIPLHCEAKDYSLAWKFKTIRILPPNVA